MSNFTYPTSVELIEIAQDKMPRLMADRPIFDIMPIEMANSHLLEWEIKGNFIGLQQVRGINGAPGRVVRVGASGFIVKPGIYGEQIDINEQELLTRRKYGTFGTPIDIKDLILEAQDDLLQRRLDLIEYIGWTLLGTQTFSVANKNGVLHTDTFPLQTYRGSTWATLASATPFADFRTAKLKARGHSVRFDNAAVAYANSTTVNYLVENANANDLGGKRLEVGSTINNLTDTNKWLLAAGLPQIREYDEGYYDDSGTFHNFIADNKVIIVGARPAGQKIAGYRMTMNASNPNAAPGPAMKVIDHSDDEAVANIQVYDGHNGGPVVYYPSSVIDMDVS